MIGSPKECSGLYYFSNALLPNGQVPTSSHGASFIFSRCEVMLWHQHLGHPSFVCLKHVFLLVFKNKELSLFQSEVCELAKHHRTPFPS